MDAKTNQPKASSGMGSYPILSLCNCLSHLYHTVLSVQPSIEQAELDARQKNHKTMRLRGGGAGKVLFAIFFSK